MASLEAVRRIDGTTRRKKRYRATNRPPHANNAFGWTVDFRLVSSARSSAARNAAKLLLIGLRCRSGELVMVAIPPLG